MATPPTDSSPARASVVLPVLIVLGALAFRCAAPGVVFRDGYVNLRGNDAWYHLRVIDHLIHNFPERLTVDPYAVAGGQYVPLAPLFDLLVAAVAWILGAGAPSETTVLTVAAVVPPILGALTTLLVYQLGARLFDRRAGLLAAALVAIMPSPFLVRTMLGFADHHALEVCLAVATILLMAIALARRRAGRPTSAARWATGAGAALGGYLLTWSSGAFLVVALGLWAGAQAVVDHVHRRPIRTAGVVVPAAVVALALVVAFQRSEMPRYDTQVGTLLLLGAVAGGLDLLRWFAARRVWPGWGVPVAVALLAAAAGGVVWVTAPGLVPALLAEASRLVPGDAITTVIEAEPLLMSGGALSLEPAWTHFRAAFFIGVPAVVVLAVGLGRRDAPEVALLVVWCVVTLMATLGQNRFGYYLGPNLALLTGWVAARLLARAGIDRATPGRWSTAAVVVVAGVVFAPNVRIGVASAQLYTGQSEDWHRALEWMRVQTPEPFDRPDHYLAPYGTPLAPPDYTVLNWWDYGYWIGRTARRVPLANPTQTGAEMVGKFFTETDPAAAGAMADAHGARYVVVNDELPFGFDPSGTLMGGFEAMLTWAGRSRADYYGIYWERYPDGTRVPIWLFYPRYYESMLVRLGVLDGAAVHPRHVTWVFTFEERPQPGGGVDREIVASRRFETYADALTYHASLGPGPHVVACRDPWSACLPLDALAGYRPVYGVAGERSSVRIFERGPGDLASTSAGR